MEYKGCLDTILVNKMMKCKLSGIVRIFIADSFVKHFAHLLCGIVCKVFSFIDCCLPEKPNMVLVNSFVKDLRRKKEKGR